MLKLLVRYLNLMVLTIFALVLLSFFLPFLFPGDTLTNISGIVAQSAEQRAALEGVYQLDKSVFHQFAFYIESLITGNWGISLSDRANLYDDIQLAFPATLELVAYALFVSIVIGIPLGFLSGLKNHNPADFSVVTFSIVGYSFPVFWLALIFITIFCLQLEWLPLSGRIDLLFDVPVNTGFILIDIALSDISNKYDAYLDALRHLILPTASVAIVTTALFIRFTRRSIMDVMKKDYIVAAKSRGFTQSQIFFKHAFKNALLPILPMLALQVSTLITNVMIIETIFSWPGVGRWLIQAIYQQDYPAIRIGMLIVSLFVMSLTITIEFITRAIDPARERAESATI
uniref:ABC transporter permease n=1 Tax=Ningiella ruwaisensis TaxID=2364274 RepID=UPI0010A04055|nr:ABC transporter permease [Ningiella ruwaisensis]